MNEEKTSKFFYGYIILSACFLIQGIGVGTFVAFGVFFKPLLAEFGWSRATISGASSLAFLLMGFLGILVGNLNDKFGPRIIMAVTGVFYGSGHFLLSQLNSVWQLYLFFGLVVGIGLSSIDVIALTTTARWFVRRRGMMTGLVKVGTGAGQMIMCLSTGMRAHTASPASCFPDKLCNVFSLWDQGKVQEAIKAQKEFNAFWGKIPVAPENSETSAHEKAILEIMGICKRHVAAYEPTDGRFACDTARRATVSYAAAIILACEATDSRVSRDGGGGAAPRDCSPLNISHEPAHA